nr:unnamed protein product [Spirometra erinaceieuropaei]
MSLMMDSSRNPKRQANKALVPAIVSSSSRLLQHLRTECANFSTTFNCCLPDRLCSNASGVHGGAHHHHCCSKFLCSVAAAVISMISVTPSESTTMTTTTLIPTFDRNVPDESSANILTTTNTPSSRNVNSF